MSSIANAKAVMDYVRANQRPSCCNCLHVAEPDAGKWRCDLGGFLTTAMATCAKHEAGKPVWMAEG